MKVTLEGAPGDLSVDGKPPRGKSERPTGSLLASQRAKPGVFALLMLLLVGLGILRSVIATRLNCQGIT